MSKLLPMEVVNKRSQEYSSKQFRKGDLVEGSGTFDSNKEVATFIIARRILATVTQND